jgi:hypothetical protein
MTNFEFEIADSSPCFFCNEELPLDLLSCSSCANPQVRYTAVEIYHKFYEGHIIDARAGGLVLGRHHNEDDIPMLFLSAVGVFDLSRYMQGGEYILNIEASVKHKDRLEEINSYMSAEYSPIKSLEVSDKTRIFNTNGIKGELIILFDSAQFVVNRAATKKHFTELEKLNNSVTHKLKKL